MKAILTKVTRTVSRGAVVGAVVIFGLTVVGCTEPALQAQVDFSETATAQAFTATAQAQTATQQADVMMAIVAAATAIAESLAAAEPTGGIASAPSNTQAETTITATTATPSPAEAQASDESSSASGPTEGPTATTQSGSTPSPATPSATLTPTPIPATPTVVATPGATPVHTATPTATSTPAPTPTPSPTATQSPHSTGLVIECILFKGSVFQSQSDEYVQIRNTESVAIDLAGWKLRDLTQDSLPPFSFTPYLIQPGAVVRVYTNEIHPEFGGFSFGRGSAIWADNKSDIAGLFAPSGELVSQASYDPDNPPGC